VSQLACTDTTPCSDDPTADRRTIDDVVVDLHELVAAAELPGPYLLIGNSGGGLIVAQHALERESDQTRMTSRPATST
jgi:pimeloyl-ACP methyl ester carboxylesterase